MPQKSRFNAQQGVTEEQQQISFPVWDWWYYNGRGSHATRVYADNENTEKSPVLESAAITSGNLDTITSLRSETSSLLSGLYILNLLSIFYSTPINVTVHVYYDNCESLRRVDTQWIWIFRGPTCDWLWHMGWNKEGIGDDAYQNGDPPCQSTSTLT